MRAALDSDVDGSVGIDEDLVDLFAGIRAVYRGQVPALCVRPRAFWTRLPRVSPGYSAHWARLLSGKGVGRPSRNLGSLRCPAQRHRGAALQRRGRPKGRDLPPVRRPDRHKSTPRRPSCNAFEGPAPHLIGRSQCGAARYTASRGPRNEGRPATLAQDPMEDPGRRVANEATSRPIDPNPATATRIPPPTITSPAFEDGVTSAARFMQVGCGCSSICPRYSGA